MKGRRLLAVYSFVCGALGCVVAWLASLCVSGTLAQCVVFSGVCAAFTVACALWFVYVTET